MRTLSLLLLGFILFGGAVNAYAADRRGRLLAIAIAEDERRLDPDSLTAWSQDDEALVRKRTAFAIGIVGDTLGIPAVKRLLNDPDVDVRLEAIFAGGQLAAASLLPDLQKLLEHPDETTQLRCVEAISKIGGDTAAAAICVVATGKASVAVRAIAARSSFRLKDDTSAKTLLTLAASPDSAVAEAAFYAISRRKIANASGVLRAGLDVTNENIRCYAADGLARIADSSSVGKLLVTAIGASWRVQYHCIDAAERLGAQDATQIKWSTFKSPYVQAAALRTITRDNSRGVDETAIASLLNGEVSAVAAEAMLALTRIHGSIAETQQSKFQSSRNVQLRIALAQACGISRDERARATLTGLLKDPVPLVRGEALDQSFAFNDTAWTRANLVAGLNDTDLIPLVIACGKITQDSLRAYIPPLAVRYGTATSNDMRESLLDALTQLATSKPEDAPLQIIAAQAMAHEDFFIRRRGRELAAKVGMKIPPSTDHFISAVTAENYDEIYDPKQARPRVEIETSRGKILIELFADVAPKTVYNFLKLTRSGYYNNKLWHRVVPDFVIQDGCPRGDGWGGPGYTIRCEYNALPYGIGAVGMATSGKDTGGSQYFICQSPQPHLDGRYTLFGQAVAGMEIALQMQVGDRVIAVREITQ